MKRSELKAKAKAQLKGRWGLAIGTFLVALIIVSIFSLGTGISEDSTLVTIITMILSLVVNAVISIGICKFALNIAGEGEAKFTDIFSGISVFLKAIGLYLLVGIAVGIGFIILIVPGIILALMFSQTCYILAEDKDISIIDCMKKSAEMMKGHKGEYFVLLLSFLGWAIVAAIPFGLGYLWLVPYQQVTFADYYLELKKESEAE